MKRNRAQRHKKKKRRLLKISIILLSILCCLLIYVYSSAQKTLRKTYVKGTPNSSKISPDKPLTILFMGVDTGDNARGGNDSWEGNSDSQIIMTLNPSNNTTTLISIERDTMSNIEDNTGKVQSTQKMNAAYPLGYSEGGISKGAEYVMKTIGSQVGLDINDFVIVNMDGLVNLVNDVGGIEVINDTNGVDASLGTKSGKITLPGSSDIVDSGAIYISNTEPEYTSYVPYIAGSPKQLISGEQALVFSRDRDTLQNGNYGRAAHQRQVMTQLINKMISINNIFKYKTFLSDISSDFKTNISSDLSNLEKIMKYKKCFNKIVSIQYQGVSQTVNGISYEFLPENVGLAIQNIMRLSSNKQASNTLNKNVITYEEYFDALPQYYYMPSATVTLKGKGTKTYGIDTAGEFVTINQTNSENYVASTVGAVQYSK